jgi:nitrogen regulatory protein PII-like uncharacterized protein
MLREYMGVSPQRVRELDKAEEPELSDLLEEAWTLRKNEVQAKNLKPKRAPRTDE